jgi:hypothetical protein
VVPNYLKAHERYWKTLLYLSKGQLIAPNFIIVKILKNSIALLLMQLHTGAEHFGNVIKRGVAKRGCS